MNMIEKGIVPLFEDQNMLFDHVVVLFVIEYYNRLLNVLIHVEHYSLISLNKKFTKKNKIKFFKHTDGRFLSPLSREFMD